MATKLSNQFFLNSAVTLTSKFQAQMIDCLCLKNAWPDLHETKSSVNKLFDLFHMTLATDLASDLDHEFQGQILKLPCLWNIGPDRKKNRNKKGWIFWMSWYFVDNIWSTFYFHRMLQCRSGMTFLSLWKSLWAAYRCYNCDGVYLGHKTCWGAFLSSLHIHTAHVWNSQFFK